jgi:hypothetical protein
MGRTALHGARTPADRDNMSRVAAALVAAGVVATALVIAPVKHAVAGEPYSYCPPAGNLVTSNTEWHHHRLAPGVTLTTATLRPGPHRLRINVVRANLARRRVAVSPLHTRLTHRHRLSTLAKQPHLVAATNGMYFNFTFGSPTVPLMGARGPLVLSTEHEKVAGIGADGRARDGHAWLVGSAITSQGVRERLVGINEIDPPPGLSIYTSAWGTHKVPRPPFSRALVVRHGRPIPHTGHHRHVPARGILLVANNLGALGWMDSLRPSSTIDISYHAKTNTHHPFRQAYGVGTRVVASPNHVRGGLYCNKHEIYAARTDIAWADHGRQLILATVASPKGGKRAGVDENQMSEIMVDLGAERSYALDGGGSTDMVARVGHHALAPISPLPKGKERPIPVGVGVFSLPKSAVRHHHGKHHHGKHHKPKHKCVLGVLLCHN